MLLAMKFNKFVHASKSKPTKKTPVGTFLRGEGGLARLPQRSVARTKIDLLI